MEGFWRCLKLERDIGHVEPATSKQPSGEILTKQSSLLLIGPESQLTTKPFPERVLCGPAAKDTYNVQNTG